MPEDPGLEEGASDPTEENGYVLQKRGQRTILLTSTLFLNDDEEGWIEFISSARRARIRIVFEPKMPPKPQLRFTPQDGYLELTLLGWNAPLAYSAISPITIGSFENNQLSVSLCNSRLGETNKLEIQFYEEVTERERT
jgi:hypothetical protein